MKCPRRTENPFAETKFPGDDTYNKFGCSYCGSASPETFFAALAEGAELIPTDKNYKVYFRKDGQQQEKFYFQHLSEEQQTEFINLMNTNTVKMAVPGHFYVLPFFCKAVP